MKAKKGFWIACGIFTFLAFYLGARLTLIYRGLPNQALENTVQNILDTFDKFLPTIQQKPFLFSFPKEALIGGGAFAVFVLLIFLYQLSNQKNYRQGEEYGSASWGENKDIQPFINKNYVDNILITNTERLTMENRLPQGKKQYERNKNVLIIGGAGSGKTRFYATPNLLQMHSSYVVTDSKGDLLRDTGQLFKDEGYKIKVFDLVTRKNTDGYNPFHYIKDEDDIIKIVDNLMKNTSDPNKKGGDDFWQKAETAFLQAMFHFLMLEAEPEERTISKIADLVRSNKVKEDNEDYLTPLDVMFQELAEKNPNCFAVKQYETFKLSAGKTAKSILISLGVRLAPFDIPSIQKITSKDTLELDKIGDEKTIFYLVLPDSNTTFNFLVSMVYQQMFDLLLFKADNEYGGQLPIPVRCILDEFANIGQIPNFDNVVATIRSRLISVNIMIQNVTQISKKLYKDTWESIVGNCDSLLYLGGNEENSHQYVSKALGKQTIDIRKTGETKGSTGSWNVNHDKMARELMTPDEIRRMSGDKCIYLLRGVKPFFSNKYDVTKHKLYKAMETNTTFIYDSPLDTFEETVSTQEVEEVTETLDEFLENTVIETVDMDELEMIQEQEKDDWAENFN
ncbi:type IV secretory system conjugative DNA transfer family protein [Enterococcus faecalis]|nr:type IV secretory system conjugative DNA transfer family protein [Enterococcus faecalis]